MMDPSNDAPLSDWEVFHEQLTVGLPIDHDAMEFRKIRYSKMFVGNDLRTKQECLHPDGLWVEYEDLERLPAWITLDGRDARALRLGVAELDVQEINKLAMAKKELDAIFAANAGLFN